VLLVGVVVQAVLGARGAVAGGVLTARWKFLCQWMRKVTGVSLVVVWSDIDGYWWSDGQIFEK
jgi:hypothetical protein